MTEPVWDIAPGMTLVRRDLHDRWGGSRFGGMEPAPKAASVFLFSKPDAGAKFGYKFDGLHADGTLHYTGDGQVGDQSPDDGGNKALLAAGKLGRAVRVFRSTGVNTTYVGEFELLDPPFYTADAPDRNGENRSVLVFRLRPMGQAELTLLDKAAADIAAPVELPLEATNVTAYALARPDEPQVAVRREAEMVARYEQWLTKRGEVAVRHRIPLPEGGSLFTDVFNRTTSELIEAKASSARTYVRAGLGQLLDYARFVPHSSKALLLPGRPAQDLIDLLRAHGVRVIWESNGGGFCAN
jgi:hypothetical protein